MTTMCEKCLHNKVCVRRDAQDEDYERAMQFCSDFKMESMIALKIISEIDSKCIDTFGNFNYMEFARIRRKYTEMCNAIRFGGGNIGT